MFRSTCPVITQLANEYFTLRGTRDLAVEATKNFPVGTVGHAVHRAVEPAYHAFGNFWSGDIGHHYSTAETQHLLAQPATAENIRNFARRETEWWKEQSGGAGLVGGSFPAEWREAILNRARNAA